MDVCSQLGAIPGLKTLAMTTNGACWRLRFLSGILTVTACVHVF